MTDKNENNIKLMTKTGFKVSQKIGRTKSHETKTDDSLTKVLLKGKLFGLINKCNVMTDEKFREIQTKITLSIPKKYTTAKQNKKKSFYYAQKNPCILNTQIISDKFEDDRITAKDFITKNFTLKERRLIFKYPQYFKLFSNDALKELTFNEHRNLSEIITNEEEQELLSHKKRKFCFYNPKLQKFPVLNARNHKKLYTNFNTANSTSTKKFSMTSSCKMATTFNFNVKPHINVFTPTNCKNINLKYNSVEMMNRELNEEIKEKEKKMIEKFEQIQKRRKQYQQEKNNNFIEINKKNLNAQKMKEKDRYNKYNEKKYIDLILKKIKTNYNKVLKKGKK